jgi:uncharacterized protein YlxW (UPF0749 family)
VERFNFTPDRVICNVFEEMRTCLETSNFSYLKGLIEEAQSYANRMESALENTDMKWIERRNKTLKDDKRKLKKEIIKLEKKKDELKNG